MRYKGAPYPILKTSKGYFCSTDDITQIKANMLAIIMTNPGERIMEFNFGCPLDKLNLSQPMELLVDEARQIIASALKAWEKRVQVTNVEVAFVGKADMTIGYDINITVSFIDPIDLQQQHMLTLQKPLDGVYYG